MEPEVIRSERRGRKRRRQEIQNVSANQQAGTETKKRIVPTRSKAFVGRYVKKEFEGSGVFLGKVVYYDSGLYRVDYEDGDCEDLESGEVREFLVQDSEFDEDLLIRKKKLDEIVSGKSYESKPNAIDTSVETPSLINANVVDRIVEASSVIELGCGDSDTATTATAFINSDQPIGNDGLQVDSYADSSSDSCEYVWDKDFGMEAETVLVPQPQLPPSSGTIGVPEDYVSHLFSVYSFLRSFSIRLFLSPFGLDDFVGSLNCCVPNTLLDAVHVALMRALMHSLETLSSNGSEHASKCLRCIDWSLLDTFTWPVYLVQYLTVMGYTMGPEWNGFYSDVLDREYYTLPASKKLMILQILCDDVLDSAELRAEIDMREESEVGVDSDVTTNPLENGPRRVHPKYSKTSACKGREAMEIIAESHEIRFPCNSNSTVSKGDVDTGDTNLDTNSDECRVCGMDGTLLCCDGCPSAYHSRCIGVSKMSIPGGSWFCPECTINKFGPTLTMGTSLRGAEVFGIDLYGQLFLGTCDHLLVLKASTDTEPCLKYYNKNDIVKILQALYLSVQHTALYSGICKLILQYWNIPESILGLPERVESSVEAVVEKVDADGCTLLLHPSGRNICNVLNPVEGDNFARSRMGSSIEKVGISCIETLDTMTQNEHPPHMSSDTATKQVCPLVSTKLTEQIKVKPIVSSGSVSQQDRSDVTHQRLASRLTAIDFATCSSIISNSSNNRHASGMCLSANMPSQSREVSRGVTDKGGRWSSDECLYLGSSFKSHSYSNHYSHGEFAASAAANLTILSSDENRVSEAHGLDNPRKIMSANVLLQVKAFSSVANRFFWPNPEKKLVEVPRERCGWCLSCKAPATSKKACLLNAAALNAIRGAMKILAGLRSVRNGEGSLPSIATYILYMEESLHGLTVGPFLSASNRRHWRKQVEQASTCNALKSVLLELEGNIRIIALSPDWVKLVDNWSNESSSVQNVSSSVGPTQKRGPSGRRSRKLSAISEDMADDRLDITSDFNWWRGGKLSKIIFQKGLLPRTMVQKAARQGGKRKIPGIYYAEGFEIPRRSRQFMWRTAVEMSNNASQLALQVRYLDLHIRWCDLLRPEQNIQEGKGPETEASAFRNALIKDKKVLENKITYGVAFRNQKHLPSRVMKNIIEVEQCQDGKDKYWFSETRIPLYMIKEYEAKAEEAVSPSPKGALNVLSKLQRRQLKASRRDVFSYLTRKGNNWDKCFCASCQMDVMIRDAVKCGACQGYCHQHCMINSTVHSNEEVEFLITCKQCYDIKAFALNESSNDSPSSPLPLQGRGCQNALTGTKGANHKDPSQLLPSVMTLESGFEMKQAAPDSSLATKKGRRLCSWGIIWRKKNIEDNGFDFRLKNILLRGNPNMDGSKPVCHLCHKPYNSDLMYVCCETCKNWYHGDAVELEESKIFDVVGFKCCKCRRIRSPICPFMDPESMKPESRKLRPRVRTSKHGNAELDLGVRSISKQPEEWEPTTPVLPMKEEVFVQEDDPLLFSISQVEQIAGHEQILEKNSEVDVEFRRATGSGLQKLPVRRHVKREADADGYNGDFSYQVGLSDPLLTDNHLLKPTAEASSPLVEWDAATSSFEDGMVFDYEDLNYEDMEFEPQTYFSFKELLDFEDGGEIDGFDVSGNVSVDLDNSSSCMQDGIPEPNGMGNDSDKQESKLCVQPAVNMVHCQVCSYPEPAPDLSCQVCGLWMHSRCSPWVESSSGEDNWKCGSCREWR